MHTDIDCPYCGHGQDINHDDGYGFREEEVFNQICNSCQKTFTFTTSIIYHYEVEKADCLNGGEHNWEPTHSFPKEYTKMRCTMCDDERDPTMQEREQFKIPSHQAGE